MRRIAPTQGLTLFFLTGLILLVLIFRDQLPLWRSLILRYAIWIGLLFAIRLSSERRMMGRLGTFFEDYSPILFVVLIYESLGDLIHYLHPDIDPRLIRIDFFLFGVHPAAWMERWVVPWLTDLMSFFYISYYFLPAILIVTLSFKNPKEDFRKAVFVLLFGYYVSFIGYILFPAVGPRYSLETFQLVPLKGGFLTDFVRDTLNSLEHNKRDCMPSGHTQLALMVLYLARRYQKALFWILLPMVAGLILSTIYLRYHYVIDVFVGAAVAAGCMLLGPGLYEVWNQTKEAQRS